MGSNKLIWVLLAVLVGGFVVAIVNKSNDQAQTAKKPAAKTAEPVAVKDVSGDTVAETLKANNAKLIQMRQEGADREEKLLEEINRLRQETQQRDAMREEQKKQEIAKLAEDARRQILDESEKARAMIMNNASQISSLSDSMSDPTASKAEKLPKDSGGTANERGYKFNDSDLGMQGEGLQPQGFNNTLIPGYVAIKPMKTASSATAGADMGQAGKGASSAGLAPTSESLNPAPASNAPGAAGGKKKPKNTSIPYYTLHANATGMDATAMTAMIGRVPVGGRSGDRFPVKFILGNDTLSANGHRIPGLQGIIFSGLATGNWSMSCVSVALTSATFVFNDGRIQHLPSTVKPEADGIAKELDPTDPLAGQGAQKIKESIGYISTQQGVPCIPGKQITDAPRQLATMGVLGAARAYFDAKAKAETTRIANLETGTAGSVVTGDTVKFANNDTAANTVGTVMDFYQQRMRDTFDVIFVEPGQQVALHIEQDLLIDYNTNARKIAYNRSGGQTQHALD